MNADVEATLKELGNAAEFAAALRGAEERRVDAGFALRVGAAVAASERLDAACRRRAWWAAAASVAVLLAASSLFLRAGARKAAAAPAVAVSLQPHVQAFVVTALARSEARDAQALAQAVDALVASQSAEGGWTNPEMSARNVAALDAALAAGVTSAKVALRRGRRYLRVKGIPEIDAASFAREARLARARLGG